MTRWPSAPERPSVKFSTASVISTEETIIQPVVTLTPFLFAISTYRHHAIVRRKNMTSHNHGMHHINPRHPVTFRHVRTCTATRQQTETVALKDMTNRKITPDASLRMTDNDYPLAGSDTSVSFRQAVFTQHSQESKSHTHHLFIGQRRHRYRYRIVIPDSHTRTPDPDMSRQS